MKVAIIGKGRVGKAIGEGLERTGHQVRYGHRVPSERPALAADWGEMAVLAVPYHQVENVVANIGHLLDDKIVIDVTNRLGPNGEPVPCGDISGAERLQEMLPLAKVVKAFNTVSPRTRAPRIGDERLTAFGRDDAEAKTMVMSMMGSMGFDPWTAALRHAQYLEAMGLLMIKLAFEQGMGPSIGYSACQEMSPLGKDV